MKEEEHDLSPQLMEEEDMFYNYFTYIPYIISKNKKPSTLTYFNNWVILIPSLDI